MELGWRVGIWMLVCDGLIADGTDPSGAGHDLHEIWMDARVDYLPVNGNGYSSQFVGSDSDSVDNYALLSEVTPDDDATYVQSAAPAIDGYTKTACPVADRQSSAWRSLREAERPTPASRWRRSGCGRGVRTSRATLKHSRRTTSTSMGILGTIQQTGRLPGPRSIPCRSSSRRPNVRAAPVSDQCGRRVYAADRSRLLGDGGLCSYPGSLGKQGDRHPRPIDGRMVLDRRQSGCSPLSRGLRCARRRRPPRGGLCQSADSSGRRLRRYALPLSAARLSDRRRQRHGPSDDCQSIPGCGE